MSSRVFLLAITPLLVFGAAATAAPPVVPAQLSYQGVLLDDLGAPLTGPVDMTVRIFDGTGGGATLLYRQNYLAVPLADGVFSIVIGPTGTSTESPLTTDLVEVFTGDLVSGPDRFVELTADGDTAQARVQILSAPLALRAESAATADAATTATSVTTINGLDPSALNQIFQYGDFDGGAPPNDDPSEGLGDADGDGIANFLESDNDADGLSDVLEVAEGSDINLVTPKIAGVNPTVVDFGFPALVTVSGSGFEAGMSVVFGSENPAPSNLSGSSFDVTVGPQAQGFPNIQVTRINGESDVETGLFEFSPFTPTVTSVVPGTVAFGQSAQITVTGTNFEPGITVVVGSEAPVPSSVTATSFDVTVGPQTPSVASVAVTRLNGVTGTGLGLLEFLPLSESGVVHGIAPPYSSFDVIDSGVSVLGEWVDRDANQTWEWEVLIDPSTNVVGTIDLGFDATDRLVGLLAIKLSGVCNVRYRQESDTNYRLFDGESIAVESFGLTSEGCTLSSADMASLSGGEGVIAYTRLSNGIGTVVLAADHSGNDDFGDAGELVELVTGISSGAIEVAADSGDHVAAIFTDTVSGSSETRLVHDLNADGDYLDTGEDLLLGAFKASCLGVGFGALGVSVVYQDPGNAVGPTLLQDRNGDGDFDDANEQQDIAVGVGGECAIAHATTGPALMLRTSTGNDRLYVDRDGDGLFTGVSEISGLGASPVAADVSVDVDSGDTVFGLNGTRFFELAP